MMRLGYALAVAAGLCLAAGVDGRLQAHEPSTEQGRQIDPIASRAAVDLLQEHLSLARATRGALDEQAFATVPLTRADAAEAQRLLWQDHERMIRQTRAAEIDARQLRDGELTMPFFYEVFGEKPKAGRSLFISLHGGGGAPQQVNDQHWENQKRLYRPDEGVYLAPRAPTDSWDLWHQPHIDRLFDRLIEDLIVFEDVDPNRVYLLGYSAGGDGVFKLAPRMADRWAAAAMMAGHPNGASPVNLRNVAFTIHVGGNDAAYDRNKVAGQWQQELAALHAGDPAGYTHLVKIYPNKGHWLDGEDAAAVPWMASFSRNPLPKRVVWKDGVTKARFYWLAIAEGQRAGAEIVAELSGGRISIQPKGHEAAPELKGLVIRLNDQMLDLNMPVRVTVGSSEVFRGMAPRTIGVLHRTLAERGDPTAMFSSEVAIALPAATKDVQQAVSDETGRPANGRFRVIGYLPEYRMRHLDPDVGKYLTDLVYFSVEAGPAGEFKRDRLKSEHLATLRAIKKKHGVALFLCVGGWGRSADFAPMAASADARRKFVAAATQFCLENRFDGIDLDWEHPAGDEECGNFAALLAEMKGSFEPHHLQLSIAAAGWQTLPPEAIAAVDRVHLMAYDGDGRHSTPEFARAEVARLIGQGVPAGKICLGVPFYGRAIRDRAKTQTYAEIVRRHQPAPEVDEVDGIYFNGPVTIARKTNEAIESKLGGIMVWELGQDAAGDQSLLRAIQKAIGDRR
ncbi:MAG TPA: glycosyl hydrolase family 18 protein [Pirellulales bacterium]|nr:glycosyl hydrolase family 18 protein [Pirellulales bacterium]